MWSFGNLHDRLTDGPTSDCLEIACFRSDIQLPIRPCDCVPIRINGELLELIISDMEMRRGMVIIEHTDHNSIKPTYFRPLNLAATECRPPLFALLFFGSLGLRHGLRSRGFAFGNFRNIFLRIE